MAVSIACAVAAACAHAPVNAPERQQDCPVIGAAAGEFRAGFGRADITTPPGPGLAGYGPEGRAARGWWRRIHARAMALEGGDGERLVFATVDLDYAPASLHRAVAARVARCGGPDASRIIVSATHTHSAPGHFSMHRAYDENASSVAGYDPAILEFFAERTAHAILRALATLTPAQAAWGRTAVWGITRVRSFTPHMGEAHDMPWDPVFVPPSDLPAEFLHADPTLLMLRVDTVGAGGAAPAGAFSIFAMHGTGNTSFTDMIDADVWAVPQRELEWRIDSINGALRREFGLRSVHVMANGPEGDAMAASSRFPHRDSIGVCDLPRLRRPLRPGGYRSPPAFEEWEAAPRTDVAACTATTRDEMGVIGQTLADAALALHSALGDSLRSAVSIARTFEAVGLRSADDDYTPPVPAIPGLCPRGRPGSAAAGGAESARTRIYGARLLFFPIGTESGGAAVKPGNDCHSPKRTVARFLEESLVGAHGVEQMAQFTVARIGSMLIGTVPFEATTTAGARMRAALRQSAGTTPASPTQVAVLGLANGFLQYVTTRSEYAFQYYEGGSTIYGPGSAEVYTQRLAGLAGALAASGWRSTAAEVPEFPFFPGPPVAIMPRRREPPATLSRTVESVRCEQGVAILRWIDARPGALFPADAQILAIEEERNEGWIPIAWDDHTDVEIRVVTELRRGRSLWEARWLAAARDGRFRFVLTAREGIPLLASPVLQRCS
jgi:neutral ceramidase